MAAWKINGAGDHAVTRTKTIFYFAAWPDLSMDLSGRRRMVGLCWMSGR